MRYRQITSRPAFASVERLTIIPLLPDGTLGGLLPKDDDGAAAGAGAPPPSTVPGGGTPLSGDPAVLGPDTRAVPLALIHGEVVAGESETGAKESRAGAEESKVSSEESLEADGSLDAEELLDAAAAQIAATQAGLEIASVQVVAAEGLPEAQHLIVWALGWPSAQFVEHGARLEGLAPDELRRRVSSDQGLIPGGASAAWIVADVAATIARRGQGTS